MQNLIILMHLNNYYNSFYFIDIMLIYKFKFFKFKIILMIIYLLFSIQYTVKDIQYNVNLKLVSLLITMITTFHLNYKVWLIF